MATTHALPETDLIDRRDLKKYPREVQDLLMELVNRYHVRFKHKDGTHLFLYSPDGISRPRKVSASRPGPQQVDLLIKWAREHLNADFVHQQDVLALAQKLNSPEHPIDVHAAKTLGRRIPVTPEPAAAAPEPTYDELQALITPGWTRHMKGKGATAEASHFETNGQHFRCLKCKAEGQTVVLDNINKLGPHTRVKHSIGFDHLRDPEVIAKSRAVKVEKAKAAKEAAEAKAPLAAVPPLDPETAEAIVEAAPAEIDTTGWTPFLDDEGKATGWLVNAEGDQFKCLACLAAGEDVNVKADGRARNGHMKFKHQRTQLTGNGTAAARAAAKATKTTKATKSTAKTPYLDAITESASTAKADANLKRQTTRQINKMSAKMEAAIELLSEGLEVTVDKDALRASERRIKELEKQVAQVEKERDEAIKAKEDAETKISMLKETLDL